MPRRRAFLATATGVAAWLAGCSGGDGTESTAGDQQSATGGTTATAETETTATRAVENRETVEMSNTSFSPLRLEVQSPVRVRWVNRDRYGHDVQSAQFHDAAAQWDYYSGSVGADGEASHVFEEPGVYEYYCTIHGESTMCGAVLVGDVSLEQSLPCE